MSGHKRTTVTISQEEYRRLYEAERKSYYDVLAIPEDTFLNSVQQSQDSLMKDFHRIAERQATYENVLKNFQDEVRDVEQATSNSLVAQQVEFYNRLLDLSESMWEDTSHLIQIQTNEFYANVESTHQNLQYQIMQFDEKMNWFYDKEEQKKQLAVDWINDSMQLYHFIDLNYPAELCDLSLDAKKIQLAERNYQSDLFESSIAAAQDAFFTLSEKRLHCEKILANRNALSSAVLNRLKLLNQKVIESESVFAMDMHGDDLAESIDVNYWTNGKFLLFHKKTAKLFEQIKNSWASIPEEQLSEILNHQLPALSDEFVTLIHTAKRNALNAQIRFNIAQLIMASAMSQGYQPVSGNYEARDFRNEYQAHVRARDGSEIVIRVEPHEELQQVLHLENIPGSYQSESEMKRRMIEVIQSLQPMGFSIGQIQAVDTQSDAKLTGSQKSIREKKKSYRVK